MCSYVGELISLDDVDVRYPDDLPRYLFDVGGGFYLDAQDSAHFSRYFNHDEHGSLRFVVDKTKRTIDFFAARPIAHGDELTFDYGPGYWIGLELKPATGTDTRDFTLKKEEAEVRSGGERRCGKKQMPTPITIAELEALSALGDDHERRLALLRCLEFFGAARLSDPAALAAFSLRCECAPYGGFAKCVGNHPDVLHSYFALCGLAIVGAPGLRPLDCRLGMTKRAAAAAGLRAAEPEAVECE